MLSPDDQKQYEWRSVEGFGALLWLEPGTFVWRVMGRSDSGGLVTFQYQGGVLSTITLAAGESFCVEPYGMRPGGFAIQFSAGVTHWVIEFLRKPQTEG